MLRTVLSVIAGYVTMFLVVFFSFSIAMLIIGVERTYKPDGWDVSATWLATSFVLGLAAAIVGGWVSGLIARGRMGPPRVLALVVLVLGFLMAAPALFVSDESPEPAPPPRAAHVSSFEAMQYSKEPVIALILNPVIGAVGVLLGASLARRPLQPASTV